MRALAIGVVTCAASLWLTTEGVAQPGQRGGGPAGPPASSRASAPIDLTGYWVSIVNEDWRWRMVAAPKGDYPGLPLNAAARKVADAWEPSMDGRCEAYGAAGLMRMPTRLNITWENDTTLKIDTDAGQQTRRFFFDSSRQPGAATMQGHSVAEWERSGGRGGAPGRGGPAPAGRGAAAAAQGGSLKVVTTNLRPGWLRRNGAPYSAATTLTEHFDRFAAPDGAEWIVITSIVTDPMYLTGELVTSTHFKRERDGAKWSPSPCRGA